MSSHSLPTTLCRCPQAVHCCHEDRLCLADLKPGNLLVKPGAPGPAVYLCDVEAVMALPKVCAGSTPPHCTPLTAVPRCGTLTCTTHYPGKKGGFVQCRIPCVMRICNCCTAKALMCTNPKSGVGQCALCSLSMCLYQVIVPPQTRPLLACAVCDCTCVNVPCLCISVGGIALA